MANSVKHAVFILFVLILEGGVSFCFPVDQAGRLRALRRAKLLAQKTGYDDIYREESSNAVGHQGQEHLDAGNMEADLIEGGLPGQPSRVPKFKQYAGYVTVDDARGRSLFYYFSEAVHDPSSRPLILWLNGGPGCSSLGVGAMAEIGPFGVNPDGKTLYLRRHAWNKVANTLFLESPAGVGFSYSNSTADYKLSGDKRTADDTYIFLLRWLQRFPQYKARDLYIMGESYSGFYIPELADIIIKRNMEGSSSLAINLQGIMIGNGIMNGVTDQRGMYDYLWTHALISDETHQAVVDHCLNSTNSMCEELEAKINSEAGPIDFDDIYSPTCLPSSSSSKKHVKHQGGFDPCDGDYLHTYLNLPQVQQAMHANSTKLPYTWEICSSSIGVDNWVDSPSTMFPTYKRLISSGLRILLYSGDVDAVVPVTSTRYSINALNLNVTKPWRPWFANSNEVGGYRVIYEGLNFSTVRGAGHEVPRTQPRRALSLLNWFLKGK